METYHSRGGITREREDDFVDAVSGIVFDGYGSESGGFAGLHVDAAEVDGATEGALNGGFEQIEFAHGYAARGYDNVAFAEGSAEDFFEFSRPVWGSCVISDDVNGSGRLTCLKRSLDR